MSVHRVMGIETEFGVFDPADPEADPGVLSHLVVGAYRIASAQRGQPLDTKWDYRGEDPLRDARGFDIPRELARPEQLTHEISHAVPNVVLPNGGRLYVDHAHPEYSSPEFTSPTDGVKWDRAGEIIARRAVAELAGRAEGLRPLLYKNNSDGKGSSYGTHENYLVERAVPFEDLVAGLVPFLVTRQIICGSGQVGIGPASEEPGFQISQRADHIERIVGLDTTARRPIINTRDEPHANPRKYRRLHLIIGDANTFDVSTWLKLGTTAAVLYLLERLRSEPDADLRAELGRLELADPVAEVRNVSRDLSLQHRLRLTSGEELTAIEIQRRYLQLARAVGATDAQTADLFMRWEDVLTGLETDLAAVAKQVEWVGKLRVLNGLRERHGAEWDDPRIEAANIHWADLRANGLAQRLRAGGLFETLITDDEASVAVDVPPADTRAWFRGAAVAKFGSDVAAASWGTIILSDGAKLQRIPMDEPHRGTRLLTSDLIAQCDTSAQLIERLTG
ncbi:MAG TPA: depupylase/deamidase Dop [Actinomycetales bacterium]|nr:depupylase/deamidase Dop [Actinomycetales bacterium]